MQPAWNAILLRQFGAATEMFGNALRACPAGPWGRTSGASLGPPNMPSSGLSPTTRCSGSTCTSPGQWKASPHLPLLPWMS